MIVVNKRYYDFDYDNNAIIMFDADDAAMTLDWDPQCFESSDDDDDAKDVGKDSASQSTETVPDDAILSTLSPRSAGSPSPPKSKKRRDGALGTKDGVTWISSESPKGSRRIPYALYVAHSYTISRLKVQLTTLVDTKTVQKQQAAALQAKAQREEAHRRAAQQYHHSLRYPLPPHGQHLAAYHYPPYPAANGASPRKTFGAVPPGPAAPPTAYRPIQGSPPRPQ